MKKKLLLFITASIMVFSLTACQEKETPTPSPTKAATEKSNVEPTEDPTEGAVEETEAPAEPEVKPEGSIGFEDGKLGFIVVDNAPADSDKSEISIVDRNGSKVLKVQPTENKIPYVAIDASSLLGEKITELSSMEFTVETEHSDGKFYSTSGQIYAYTGVDRNKSSDPWSVFLANKNPNKAVTVLEEKDAKLMVPDAFNFFVVTLETDTGKDIAGSATLYIDDIYFYDVDGNVLPVDTNAAFNAPAGFGETDMSNLLTVTDEIVIDAKGSSSGWGQAVSIETTKNEGIFDSALLVPGSVFTVFYTSTAAPELILQSWTEGAPETAGWAKATAAITNNSNTAVQFLYDDIVAGFGTDDFVTYLDKIMLGDQGVDLSISKITFGLAQ